MSTSNTAKGHEARRHRPVRLPFSDRTGSKLRPALIVQADFLNQAIDDTILALITRTQRGGPTEYLVDLSTTEGKQSGLRHTSAVDCKNLLTADKRFIHATLGSSHPPRCDKLMAA
jgi:mRNA-degrading endonuclease toxin of MazEF toxin-antitoxin module